MTPERLLSSDELPPELRCIAAEHRLQRDDPAFLLLAWHWKQTEGHENRLRSLTVELTSVIDLRLRKLAEVSSSLDRMPETVEALVPALDRHPDILAKRLASVLDPAITRIATDTQRLTDRLRDVQAAFERVQRERLLIALVGGASVGALFVIALFV